MREIPLTQNKVALVDDADYAALSQHKWCAYQNKRMWYAARRDRNKQTVRMHRQILNAPDGMDVDHCNHDGLNNCRSNLRLCTPRQNAFNRRRQSTSNSPYKGVGPSGDKWRARLRVEGRNKHLGSFDTPEEASRAYDEAAKHVFGEFAYLNGV